MGPQIRSTGYLETREIRALMAASAALVLPSLEEGFGLPVVEAMAAGLPVVCSRGSALEEVAGDAAVLVNPLDTRSIADGIETILADRGLAQEKRTIGLERSRMFDWDIAAKLTLEFYRRVLGVA
jgi:glycosyltransferase involved in cell wall biosynthesis